jgi:SAM-dependent methyltransferase
MTAPMAWPSIAEIQALNRLIGRGYASNGQPRAFTEREFYEISWIMGWHPRNPEYRRLFARLADWIVAELKPERVLEIGCGPGHLLHCISEHGIAACGVDANPYSQAFFKAYSPAHADRYHLDLLFEGTYAAADTVLAIECFEHIPDDGLDNIMQRLRDEIRPLRIVFSSTPHAESDPDWDLQWGHINIKTPALWQEFFGRYGYRIDGRRPPVTEWAACYVRD